MKYCGWFEGAKGFFFGRVAFPQTLVGMTYADAVLHALDGAPVVLEGDVGHVPPRMTFVNGCLAHLRADGGKGTIDYAWAG